jgi:hypothetical protein
MARIAADVAAIPLGPPSPVTSMRPTRTATRRSARARPEGPPRPSLFGLAPGGACHAAGVAVSAVRSYRTLSPLPRERGGLLSVALSLGLPPPDVIRHPFSVEPGLSSIPAGRDSGRPADWSGYVRPRAGEVNSPRQRKSGPFGPRQSWKGGNGGNRSRVSKARTPPPRCAKHHAARICSARSQPISVAVSPVSTAAATRRPTAAPNL